jgi:hypothetical protein
MHRQHVDDVRPIVASTVAVAEQLRGDSVAVGLVVNQDAPKSVASLWTEPPQEEAKTSVVVVRALENYPTPSIPRGAGGLSRD